MKVILASHNQGKLKEFADLLVPLHWQVTSSAEEGVTDVEETGLSFVENALLKARHAAKATDLPAIADDSGVVVNALQGAPGIVSARYAGEPSDAKKNNAKLVAALSHLPYEQRTAYYFCALVFVRHEKDPTPIICEGQWHGYIQLEEKGDYGFGYDPLFYLEEYQCTAAELDPAKKNQVSHRSIALKNLVERLQALPKLAQ